MPELPEVESSVRFLKNKVLGRTFVDVWIDSPKTASLKGSLKGDFKKELKGKKIKDLKRKGKNIIFLLDKELSLLIHLKMTGHLLLGEWKKVSGDFVSQKEGPLKEDKMNGYIRALFYFKEEEQMALSDLRKFAKVELWKKEELEENLKSIGPDPLSLSLKDFKSLLKGSRNIKTLLMDQEVISGIGNIYVVEALFLSKIHPLRRSDNLSEKEKEKLYYSVKEVLKEGLKYKGDSVSDFRLPDGSKGSYQTVQKVYSRKGEPCFKCQNKIEKIKVSNRGTYFCPKCQKK